MMGFKKITIERVLVTSWLDFLVREHLVLVTLVCYFVSSPGIFMYLIYLALALTWRPH